MKDKKKIDYFNVLTNLIGAIQSEIALKKDWLKMPHCDSDKDVVAYEKESIEVMEEQIEAINYAIDMIYS